jgi:alpha-mannosidase
VNTVGFERREVVADAAGTLVVVEAPSYGAGRVVDTLASVHVRGLTLENAHLRVELAADGTVAGVVEKSTGRETLAAPGNRLELHEDRPVAFDAWDIDPAHLETRRDCPPADSWEVVTKSPLRAEIAFERRVGEASRLRQVVRLDAGSRRLELRTTVDWHESHTLLKVCFPLAARSPTATYEMPFGYAERPTHYSTSFDRARYEVPGHRFADLSEHGFGAALLTDSKYGYSCYGNELRISLLRAPKSPDPEADMGRHEIAYALLPHAGGWREAGVLAEAILFNAPLRWTAPSPHTGSLAAVDDPNLVLDTVKRAEDSDALVLRLYEAHGARGVARLRLGTPFESAVLANLLEDDGEPLERDGDSIVLPYRPHQILTVKVD